MKRLRVLWPAAIIVTALLVSACGTQGDTESAAPEGSSGETACNVETNAEGVLEPLADGFPERELTINLADNPTSADAILARTLAEAAQKYSPVAIEVEAREDFEAFGSWEALAYIIDAEGGEEGYIQHVFGSPGGIVDLHGADIEGELGLTLEDLGEVISLETRPYYVVQRTDAPWGHTWEEMVEYAKANPGEVRYMGGGPGTNTDLNLAWYLREVGAGNLYDPEDFFFANVGGIAERVLAVAAGEGDITVSTVDAAQPHFESGVMELIFITGTAEVPDFPDVPNATDIGLTDVPLVGSTKQIVVPGSVPECHIEWLYELYSAAAQDDEYVATRSAIPMSTPLIRDPEESNELNAGTYDEMEELTMDLGIHHTQTEQ